MMMTASAAAAAGAPRPFGPVPTPAQQSWNDLAFYGFCHFSINTFTGREWGTGDEDPALFAPTDFDAGQIVRAFKAGGMRGVVLTAKHHDGFCLWPSSTTAHSVKNSRWMSGRGDVVRAFADACRTEGMLFGIYLSPWDRNRADYATPAYVDVYRTQLRELLTGYGPIRFVWLDGANGGDGYYGGARDKRKIAADYYAWPTTVAMIRKLQPDAAINNGFDYRWIGNEAGITPDPCWSLVPAGSLERRPDWEAVLGHGTAEGVRWCGAETDVSIRPGWYYHPEQDGHVKSPTKIVQMYYDAVGHGQCLILNLPADRRGRIPDGDVASVARAHELIARTFARNLAADARFVPSNVRGNDPRFDASALAAEPPQAGRYWATDDDTRTPTLTIEFAAPTTLDVVRVREYVALGQRITGLSLDLWSHDSWTTAADVPNVGHERLIRLARPVTTAKLRLRVTSCPAAVVLRDVGVFLQPDAQELHTEVKP